MPEEFAAGEEQEEHARETVHDDVMQRLLEYQRHLREGVSPAQADAAAAEVHPLTGRAEAEALTATKTEPTQLVDITEAEAELEITETLPDAPPIEETIETAEAVEAEEEPAQPAAEEPTVERDEPVTPSGTTAWTDLEARIGELEDKIARVSQTVGELRGRLQDMVVSSAEHFAAIEDALSAIGNADRN